MNLTEEKSAVDKIESRLDHIDQSLKREEEELGKASDTLWKTEDAREILQRLAQAVQQQAHEKIGAVVTSCLSTVFGDDAYEFKIGFERKRGRTEANLRFVRGGLEVDPLTASGGGVVDVAAFALRVACLMLHRPRLGRLVVLDEPFRFVSAQYRENVRLMLEGLAKDLGIQIIMITHIEELATGNVIEI